MIKLHHALLTGALIALTSLPAQAADVKGTVGLLSTDVTTDNGSTDLTTVSSLVSNDATVIKNTQQGIFKTPTLVPTDTSFGTNTVDLNNLTSFSFSNSDYGNFNASLGHVVSQTANFLSVLYVGTFVPGTLNQADFGTGGASVTVNFNSNGGQILETMILRIPPVPEPASLALAGIGLAGLGLVRVFRKRSV